MADLGQIAERYHLDEIEERSEAGLVVGRRGYVALLLLNRPERGNSYNRAMSAELKRWWPEIDADPAIRAVVMGATSETVFSTGIDLREVAGDGTVSQDIPLNRGSHLTARSAEVWKPVICAVEGRANGGGLHWVVDADIVVASELATFSDSHVNVGFVGAMENIGLAMKAGLGAALYLTLVGPDIALDAQRALQLGLVQEVVAPGTTVSRALELGEMVARHSPSAVSRSQEAIWSMTRYGYKASLEYGWLLLRRQWDHPDATEGPRAFSERRPPEWTS